MALLIATAGPYSATYTAGAAAAGAGLGALSQGITADDGYRLNWTVHKQRIGNDGTDQFGQSLLESVLRGADWTMHYVCHEFGYGPMNAAYNAGRVAAGLALAPTMGRIGRTDGGSGVEGVLVMTAFSNTPASANPATLTASHVAVADNTNFSTTFTSKLREVPVALLMYPYNTGGGDTVWFVTT